MEIRIINCLSYEALIIVTLSKLDSPGAQGPGFFVCNRTPHERLQLWLDVQVEDGLLAIDVQACQYSLLLGWHALDNQRTVQLLAFGCLVLDTRSIYVTAVVLAAARQIGQLDVQNF